MIHKVRIQNFKSLRDVSVELERFTVFVGANGSGKTSVLEAIINAVQAVRRRPTKGVRPRATRGLDLHAGRGGRSVHPLRDGGRVVQRRSDPAVRVSAAAGTDAEVAVGVPHQSVRSLAFRRIRTGPEDGVPAVECGGHGQAIVLAGRSATGRVHRRRAGLGAGVHGAEQPARVRRPGGGGPDADPPATPHPLSQGEGVPDRERAGPIRQRHGEAAPAAGLIRAS